MQSHCEFVDRPDPDQPQPIEAKLELRISIDPCDNFTRAEIMTQLCAFGKELNKKYLEQAASSCFDLLDAEVVGYGLLEEEDILWVKKGAAACQP